MSTYDTLNRTVYGFTARRHRAASYAYISIRVVYSRLFIRLSFNCPISARRVCNGTSRGYFALGSKVRTTMEMRTRIIACPDVPLPSDTAGLAEERVFEIHLSLSLSSQARLKHFRRPRLFHLVFFSSRRRLLRIRVSEVYVQCILKGGNVQKCRILLRDAIAWKCWISLASTSA